MMGKILGFGLVGILAAGLIGGTGYILYQNGVNLGGEAKRAHQERVAGGRGGDRWTQEGNLNASSAEGDYRADGYGRGQQGLAQPKSLAPVEEWVAVTGTVVSLDEDELVIRTDEGEAVVHLGPEWYREAGQYSLEVGDPVSVVGFYDGDQFEAGLVENLVTGDTISLRNEAGRPIWAGRGRRGR